MGTAEGRPPRPVGDGVALLPRREHSFSLRRERDGTSEGSSGDDHGCGQGNRFAAARRFAREGAQVCLTDIDEEGIRRAEESLRGEGLEVFGLRVDVTDRAQVESAVEEIVRRCGRLDILVNNAGVIRDNLLFKMTDEDWQTVMDVHLKGAFYCSRAAQKVMVEQKYGRIINISSTSALGNRDRPTIRRPRRDCRASPRPWRSSWANSGSR